MMIPHKEDSWEGLLGQNGCPKPLGREDTNKKDVETSQSRVRAYRIMSHLFPSFDIKRVRQKATSKQEDHKTECIRSLDVVRFKTKDSVIVWDQSSYQLYLIVFILYKCKSWKTHWVNFEISEIPYLILISIETLRRLMVTSNCTPILIFCIPFLECLRNNSTYF